MPRRKVTFVYDPEKRRNEFTEGFTRWPLETLLGEQGSVDSLSITVEDLPDPPIVQRFVMVVESDPEMGRFDPSGWASNLKQGHSCLPLSFRNGRRRILTITEENND